MVRAVGIMFAFMFALMITDSSFAAVDVNLLKAQCENGDSYGCQNFAREETYRHRKTQAKIFLKEHCGRKNQVACVTRAGILQSEGRYSEALQVLESSCDAGYGEACVDLATALGNAGQKNVELSMKKESCSDGSVRGCTALAVLVAAAGASTRARAILETACAKEYAPACHNLQLDFKNRKMRREAEQTRKKQALAQKSECTNGDLFSCVSLASQAGKPGARRSEYRRLCDQHVESACRLLVQIENELGETKRAVAAEAEFRKIHWARCEQSDGEACFSLATYFAPQNETKRKLYAGKARKILAKGCGEGDNRSCGQLKLIQ